MRMIFIALLIGNLVFWAAEYWRSSPAVQPKPVAAKQQNYGNLQTIAERESKSKLAQKDAKKRMPEISAEVPTNSEKCQIVGPYGEILHAEYLVERLVALEVPAVIKRIEITDGKNYWVYLKPEMSEKEALRRLYEIQAKKIDDVYIIPSGELANGISFGQFGEPQEAESRAALIRGQGYSPEIKEIPKSHSEVWVEVREKSERKVSDETWLDLLKEEKGIERRQNYCFGVAHE